MVVLPDILAPGLRIVFCGSAAGYASARRGAYYAGPGNRFWETLHAVGLTPRRLEPSEFRLVARFGLGLTDLAKKESGADRNLSSTAYDADGLRRKIECHRPRLLAFNGKAPAEAYLRRAVRYGAQPEVIGDTSIFVLPSTSGAARAFWDVGQWHTLAALACHGPDAAGPFMHA